MQHALSVGCSLLDPCIHATAKLTAHAPARAATPRVDVRCSPKNGGKGACSVFNSLSADITAIVQIDGQPDFLYATNMLYSDGSSLLMSVCHLLSGTHNHMVLLCSCLAAQELYVGYDGKKSQAWVSGVVLN